jgi:sulfate permease, SulP family
MPRIPIRGDVVGGVTAAILSIPASIGYGVLSFHALGDQYVSHAILAGLFGATIVPLAALALGNRGPTIYAPRSILALLLGSVVLQAIIPAGAKSGGWSVGQTLSALFLVILLAGVFQRPRATRWRRCRPRSCPWSCPSPERPPGGRTAARRP